MAIYWIDDQQLPLAMRQWHDREAENEPVSTRWGVMTDFSGYVPRNNKPVYRLSMAVVAAACFGAAMWIGIIWWLVS